MVFAFRRPVKQITESYSMIPTLPLLFNLNFLETYSI
nr:MAG TPA: hypothetical protein [Inoviridae sp.]